MNLAGFVEKEKRERKKNNDKRGRLSHSGERNNN